MNRDIYVTKIKTLLNILKVEIKDSGKLNLLDINVHAEDFYRDLLNLVFGWKLQNMNQWNQNAAGGDLYAFQNPCDHKICSSNYSLGEEYI